MKTYISILWLTCCAIAHAQSIYGTSFGNQQVTYRVEITGADLASTPDWLPTEENPPLSPKKAMEVARATLTQLMPETTRWDLVGIELHPTDVPNKWFYEVSFRESPRDYTVSRPLKGISTFVRMDGKSGTIIKDWKE